MRLLKKNKLVNTAVVDELIRPVKEVLASVRDHSGVNVRSLMAIGMLWLMVSPVFCQSGARPLKVFGYFQTGFEKYDDKNSSANTRTSFTLQQLNVFLQKDLARNWSAFVSLEFINTFSSGQRRGELNLDEAWLRYRYSDKFQLKLGLQIPEFNHFNAIKNRTPLMPYIFRPLVYEASLRESIFSVGESEYAPRHAFASIYGTLPAGPKKVDYAIYVGNSPNISTNDDLFQSGIDTSSTVLAGARLGFRYGELKAGLSAAYDEWDLFRRSRVNFVRNNGGSLDTTGISVGTLPRWRLGADLLYRVGKWSLESEYINVSYQTDSALDFSKHFVYGTMGWDFTDRWFGYLSYFLMIEEPVGHFSRAPDGTGTLYVFSDDSDFKIHAPNFGATFSINERVRFKAQIAHVRLNPSDQEFVSKEEFAIFATSVSIFF